MEISSQWTMFGFPKLFDSVASVSWLQRHITHASIVSVAYVIITFMGQSWMKHRQKWDLRKYLITWNVLLAVFSTLGSISCFKALLHDYNSRGLKYVLCSTDSWKIPEATFWGTLYTLSKVVEFGDTVFIILRKTPLVFLHWYHHALTLAVVWWCYAEHQAIVRLCMTMNFTIHGFMYTYYALKAARIRLPRIISIIMTTMQITQMVISLSALYTAHGYLNASISCNNTYFGIGILTFMLGSYLLLFLQFFYNSYVKPTSKSHVKMPLKNHELKQSENSIDYNFNGENGQVKKNL